jgi:hypothetical protein
VLEPANRDMIRVALTGQPFWAGRLTALLNKHGKHRLHAIDASLRPNKWRALVETVARADVMIRVGYRPGARTKRGLAFDAVWSLATLMNSRAALAIYWIGTDVARAVEAHESGRERVRANRLTRRTEHWAGAPWFVEELRAACIAARSVLFPGQMPNVPATVELPDQFTVSSYVPDLRPDFYGSRMLLELANRFPEIRFEIFGGHGPWPEGSRSNIHFLGWQSPIEPVYERSTVVARLVEHDALGGSVREGLALARHVLYTYTVPHVHAVAFGDVDAASCVLHGLLERHRRGELSPNFAGQDYALHSFDEAALTDGLIQNIERVARRPGDVADSPA